MISVGEGSLILAKQSIMQPYIVDLWGPKEGYSVETDLCNQATSLLQPPSGVPKRAIL